MHIEKTLHLQSLKDILDATHVKIEIEGEKCWAEVTYLTFDGILEVQVIGSEDFEFYGARLRVGFEHILQTYDIRTATERA